MKMVIKKTGEEDEPMDKYECTVCEYVYDPDEGDPEMGSTRGHHLKIFPMNGYVRFVVHQRTSLKRWNRSHWGPLGISNELDKTA